jgi:hypothetical protein
MQKVEHSYPGCWGFPQFLQLAEDDPHLDPVCLILHLKGEGIDTWTLLLMAATNTLSGNFFREGQNDVF